MPYNNIENYMCNILMSGPQMEQQENMRIAILAEQGKIEKKRAEKEKRQKEEEELERLSHICEGQECGDDDAFLSDTKENTKKHKSESIKVLSKQYKKLWFLHGKCRVKKYFNVEKSHANNDDLEKATLEKMLKNKETSKQIIESMDPEDQRELNDYSAFRW